MSFDLESYLSTRRAQVDDALDRVLAQGGDGGLAKMHEAMRYAVLQGGKRMRPMVAIAACEAAGGTAEQALPACCAIEFVHAYSLVHDDLPAMDDDVERRGKPTVHVAYGEAQAILVGDALLTQAFEVLVRGVDGRARPDGRMAEATARLARHAGHAGMVGGQILDLDLGQDIRDLEVLEQVHALKTGGLYAAASAMGALCGGASDTDVDALESWGLKFGIAFQHADDVLDDDQAALRDQAMARLQSLVGQCNEIAGRFGDRAVGLQAIGTWVADRARQALSGADLD